MTKKDSPPQGNLILPIAGNEHVTPIAGLLLGEVRMGNISDVFSQLHTLMSEQRNILRRAAPDMTRMQRRSLNVLYTSVEDVILLWSFWKLQFGDCQWIT
ncbi:hypothetical protein LSAT2_014117 [Lamellibrachia satsuma]|nr:hypothetical protein LSAT2_014117 [Lamellibrachia satsuma]